MKIYTFMGKCRTAKILIQMAITRITTHGKMTLEGRKVLILFPQKLGMFMLNYNVSPIQELLWHSV